MFGNECLGTLAYEATAAAVAMAGLFISFLVEYLGHRYLKAAKGEATSGRDTELMGVYVLEAGIIFHSLSTPLLPPSPTFVLFTCTTCGHLTAPPPVIGLTLVVSGDSFLLTLFAVILFHQMFEGIALGTCIAALGSPRRPRGVSIGHHHAGPPATDYEAVPAAAEQRQPGGGSKAAGNGSRHEASMARKLSLAACFALVTPVGMGIGIGVLDRFNGNDPQTIIAIGVLDALSAGVLLWVGVVEMWAADWAVAGGAMAEAGALRTAMGLGALLAGMVAMSVLGKWA